MPAKKTTKAAKPAKKAAAKKPAAKKTPSKKAAKPAAARKPAAKKASTKTASKNGKSSGTSIYDLKISLLYLNPPIWRRVQVAGDTPLDELHAIIQMAMGWTNSHMHHFMLGSGRNIQFFKMDMKNGFFAEEESEGGRYETEVTLAEVLPKPKASMTYEYDFGDSWLHEILVEKISPPEPGATYPRCIGGEYACPPEDIGGPPGYANFAMAIQNPRHPEHREMLDWVGKNFDPFKFDVEQANKLLSNPNNFVLYGPGL